MDNSLLSIFRSGTHTALLRRKFVVLLAAGLLLATGGLKLFIDYTERELAADMTHTARSRLDLYAGSLHSALNRYGYLPYILARHPDIRQLVTYGGNLEKVNHYLEDINSRAKSMDIFVLDNNGMTIAASNWKSDESFMGHDYHYRPYFQEAQRSRHNGYFAVGATTGKPGFFFSERIENTGGFAGL